MGDKWTVLVVLTLADGTLRFSELRSHIGPIAPKVLTQTLRMSPLFSPLVNARPLPLPADSSSSNLAAA